MSPYTVRLTRIKDLKRDEIVIWMLSCTALIRRILICLSEYISHFFFRR